MSATLALLTDRDTQYAPGVDRHGRIGRDASAHGRTGYGMRPIVNLYAEALRRGLAAVGLRDGIPRWPSGHRAAIGLSHDVDRPDKYALLRAVGPGGPRLWFGRPDVMARAGRDLLARLGDRAPDDFWLFDQVLQSERDLGMRSSLLFASMPSQGRYGSRHDVYYDIASSRFRRLFLDLRRADVEIGLHASYRAHVSAERIASERHRLQQLAGAQVVGLRHHYWHLGPDPATTLRHHETAGFRYDSSLAFNDRPGLRRAIALPYRPWDPVLGRPLRVLQLPVLAMDGSLFRNGTSVDEAVAELWSAIEEVREAGGLGVLDWHVRASFPANRPFRRWAACYQRILQALAEASDIWVDDLRSIESWWSRREEQLDRPGGAQLRTTTADSGTQ